MPTLNFHASVQYGDLKGSVAADRTDKGRAEDWLEQKKLKHDGEFVIGITFYTEENLGKHDEPVHIEFLLWSACDHGTFKAAIESNPESIFVRRVKTEMQPTEFFRFFKRLSIHLSPNSMLEGKNYTYIE